MAIGTATQGEGATIGACGDRGRRVDRRLGGIGGLLFVASVILQNALRASALPANDASGQRIIEYYTSHRSTTIVLAVLFPFGAIGIVLFAAALQARLASTMMRGPAFGGMLGITGVIAMFTMTLATDLGLSGYVHRGTASADVASAMWTLHNAVFSVLLVFIGLALAGLSGAVANSGLIASAWRPIGLVGGLLLATTTAAAPAVIDGSKVMVVGLVGFLAWVVFVIVTSLALLRTADATV